MTEKDVGDLSTVVELADLVEMSFVRDPADVARLLAQGEILWLCEAAQLAVIWATQVLEQLAKTGNPSLAEISDAAMSERAECVMLNKGPHIDDAVVVLDNILRRMADHHYEKTALLPALHSWRPDPAVDPPPVAGPLRSLSAKLAWPRRIARAVRVSRWRSPAREATHR